MADPRFTAETERAGMVERLRRRGIFDARVLAAMATVPRERFVPAELAGEAYEEHPLPIGAGQTISEPQIVAIMAAALALDADDQVLEVGGGAGYAAAVLSRCSGHVITIERHRVLADRARATLAALGYDNVEVRDGDGALGAPDRAPFDAISVAAMADDIPPALLTQLAPDGRLICPVGATSVGQLVRLHRGRRRALLQVGFVPLVSDTRPQ
ncbi:MAG: protein-L-isoaspartate(D-aspartate) O-methyltransferase [Jatrophihabitantaceae bacterium]